MMNFRNYILSLCLMLLSTAEAKPVFQTKLNYDVTPEIFLKKDINYSIKTFTFKKLHLEQNEIAEIVETVFPKSRKLNYIVTKSSYLINRAIANESQEIFNDLIFFKKYFNAKEVKKENDYFEVKAESFNFRHRIFYDSNDLSTLDQSRIMRSINLIKKLDIITQGSYLTVIHHQTKFNKNLTDGLIYQMFIPIKDNLTLVVNYGVYGTNTDKIGKKDLKKNLEGELIFQQALLNK